MLRGAPNFFFFFVDGPRPLRDFICGQNLDAETPMKHHHELVLGNYFPFDFLTITFALQVFLNFVSFFLFTHFRQGNEGLSAEYQETVLAYRYR
jgi:hypothetical protein